jgi:hypothetical protein
VNKRRAYSPLELGNNIVEVSHIGWVNYSSILVIHPHVVARGRVDTAAFLPFAGVVPKNMDDNFIPIIWA